MGSINMKIIVYEFYDTDNNLLLKVNTTEKDAKKEN